MPLLPSGIATSRRPNPPARESPEPPRIARSRVPRVAQRARSRREGGTPLRRRAALPVIDVLCKTRSADEEVPPVVGRLRVGRISEQRTESLMRLRPVADEDDLR